MKKPSSNTNDAKETKTKKQNRALDPRRRLIRATDPHHSNVRNLIENIRALGFHEVIKSHLPECCRNMTIILCFTFHYYKLKIIARINLQIFYLDLLQHDRYYNIKNCYTLRFEVIKPARIPLKKQSVSCLLSKIICIN